MIQSRRNSLADQLPKVSTNASLWLDKYLDRRNSEPNQLLINQVIQYFQKVPGYQEYFDNMVTALLGIGVKELKVARTLNRLAIDMGADSVLETSIALNRTYGVPFIPGSALKGLAAHFTDQRLEGDQWKKGDEAHNILFGDPDNAGYVTFFDALYIPGTGNNGKALWKDVMTVHHPEYYQGGIKPPADWDSTTIIPFLTATGHFLVALAGPEAWVDKAFEILALALEEEGIGAKTSSGYGRMRLGNYVASSRRQGHEADTQMAAIEQQPVDNYEILKLDLLKEAPPPGRYRGTIKNVEPDGRYAFINPARGGADDFVHMKQMRDNKPLQEGQVVEYSIGEYKGKDQAQDVEVLLEK